MESEDYLQELDQLNQQFCRNTAHFSCEGRDYYTANRTYLPALTPDQSTYRSLLSGQGADELFGGYHKYLEIISREGYTALKNAMEEDVKEMYNTNLYREIGICRHSGVTIDYPFMDKDVINAALRIPPEERIHQVTGGAEFTCVDEINGSKYIRKFILRKAAEELGIPGPVINRKKKAAQYGSNAHKLLVRLAKDKGYKKKAAGLGRKDYLEMFLKDIN